MGLTKLATHIRPVLRKHGVLKAAVFGSYARGEAGPSSDLDLIVKLPKDKSLLDLAALHLDLHAALGREVDVLTYEGIYHRLRDRILAEQQVIYDVESRTARTRHPLAHR